MKRLAKIFDAYVYLRMCWADAVGHLSIPMQIFDKVVLLSIFLKVFSVDQYWLMGLILGTAIIIMFLIGHFSLKLGLASKLISKTNKYNPEIQRILNATTNNGDNREKRE